MAVDSGGEAPPFAFIDALRAYLFSYWLLVGCFAFYHVREQRRRDRAANEEHRAAHEQTPGGGAKGGGGAAGGGGAGNGRLRRLITRLKATAWLTRANLLAVGAVCAVGTALAMHVRAQLPLLDPPYC